MNQTIRLGKIWNIPIGLSGSWLIIFFLVTYSLAVGYMPTAYPMLDTAQYWILGLVTSVLFFASVLFHELAHAWVALRYGVPVKRITLFIFGGVAELEKESPSAKAEFWIAIAGPIASLIAAGFFFALYLLDRNIPLLAAPSEYLVRINLILALFNMIPGFPLDGGRVLRAVVWQFTNYQRGTRIAARTGQLVAYGFIAFGVVQIATGGGAFNGLWLIFIGWFLSQSASSYGRHAIVSSILDETVVGTIMQTEWREIDGNVPVSQLIDEYIQHGGQSFFFVRVPDIYRKATPQPDGMFTTADITALNRNQWGLTPASRLMTAWQHLVKTSPRTSLTSAIQTMEERNVNHLPVVEEDTLVGVLTRENVLRHIRRQT